MISRPKITSNCRVEFLTPILKKALSPIQCDPSQKYDLGLLSEPEAELTSMERLKLFDLIVHHSNSALHFCERNDSPIAIEINNSARLNCKALFLMLSNETPAYRIQNMQRINKNLSQGNFHLKMFIAYFLSK